MIRRDDEKNRWTMVVIGVCFLAAGVLIGQGLKSSPPVTTPPFAPGGPGGAAVQPPFSGPRPPGESSEDRINTQPPEGAVRFEKLLEDFLLDAEKPEATEFAKAVAHDPVVGAQIKDFVKKGRSAAGSGGPGKDSGKAGRPEADRAAAAASFLNGLRRSKEFQRIASQFQQDPGFRGFVSLLARAPEAAAVLRHSGGGAPPETGPRGRGGPPSGPGADKADPKRFAFLQFGASDAAAPPGGPSAGREGRDEGRQAGGSGGSNAPGQQAHDVDPKLDGKEKRKDQTIVDKGVFDLKKIEKLLIMYPCLKSIGLAEVNRLITGDSVDKFGLWGACFRKNMYDTCKASGCTPPLGQGCWRSCQDAENSELQCIEKVQSQPGCSQDDIPKPKWNQYCHEKMCPNDDGGSDPCPPPPFPECGLPASPAPPVSVARSSTTTPTPTPGPGLQCKPIGRTGVFYGDRWLNSGIFERKEDCTNLLYRNEGGPPLTISPYFSLCFGLPGQACGPDPRQQP